MSINNEISRITENVSLSYDVAEAKGANMPVVKNTDNLPATIESISSGGGSTEWQRPKDRPVVPTIKAGEQVMYWLFGVQENSPNDFAITLSTSAGQYRMIWGDGTSNDYNSGARSEHIFKYSDIIGTPNSQGYKWVWIKAYPLTGNFTAIDINVRHSLRPTASDSNIFVPQVFEWYLQAQYVENMEFSTETYTLYFLLEVFEWRGTNLISSFYYFLLRSHSLKQLTVDTSNGTDFEFFMYYCSSFNQPLTLDTSNGTYFSFFMASCSSFNQPLTLDTSNGTYFSLFMANCSSFNQPLTLDTSNGAGFDYFMTNCSSFNQALTLNTSNGDNFTYFMASCSSFNQPLTLDTSNGNNFEAFMANCSSFNQPLTLDTSNGAGFDYFLETSYALKSLRLKNMGTAQRTLIISHFSLDVDALVALFGDLANRTSTTAGTIRITGTFGASRLTVAQRAIATTKNWTIVG